MPLTAIALIVVILAAVVVAMLQCRAAAQDRPVLLAVPPVLATCVISATVWVVGQQPVSGRLAVARSDAGRPGDYTTSSSCRKCHNDHYASWYATYHRSMTREATAENVLGDFGDTLSSDQVYRLLGAGADEILDTFDENQRGRTITVSGVTWHLFRAQGETGQEHFYMETLKPQRHGPWLVARTIGSHKAQVYLTSRDDGSHVTLPLVFHLGWKQWVTENGSMLRPEQPWVRDDGRMLQPAEAALFINSSQWNDGCIFCHNTKARPGRVADPRNPEQALHWRTEVEELGIACEACHGPGDEHVAAHRNPSLRYLLAPKSEDDADPTIVNPSKLSKERSVEVCGRCHGKFGPDSSKTAAGGMDCYATAMTTGDPFVPGKALSGCYLAPLPENLRSTPLDPGRYYWPNDTPRATGTEYLGVVLSDCYKKGEMTCLSCHSLHDSSPVDQLARDRQANQACIQCHEHEHYRDSRLLEEHTHHTADSAGSLCYNCHMPYVVYGVMSVNRTHRIVTPRADQSAAHGGQPMACNQCHVGQTLRWSAEQLQKWYAHPLPDLDDMQQTVAESLVRLLRGDAAERLVAAWSLGWSEARKVEQPEWAVPFLLETLNDEYAAVRAFAIASLRTMLGFETAEYDYLALPAAREEQLDGLRRRWKQLEGMELAVPKSVPLREDRQPREDVLLQLEEQKDRSTVNIIE